MISRATSEGEGQNFCVEGNFSIEGGLVYVNRKKLPLAKYPASAFPSILRFEQQSLKASFLLYFN